MDKETVDKAIELQDKIKYYEGCIRRILQRRQKCM